MPVSKIKVGDTVLVRDLDEMGVVSEKPTRRTYAVTLTSAYGSPGRRVVRTRDGLEPA